MKIIKSVYRDAGGNIWELRQETLPKKKGVYAYWIGECAGLNKAVRGKLKRDVIREIKLSEK